AGVRPFLEQWKTWREQGDGSEDLPDPEDRRQVRRVAETHDALDGPWAARQLGGAARHHPEHEQRRGRPVADRFRSRCHVRVSSQGDDERGADDVTAASTKATPENVNASKTAVHSFRRYSGVAARARGTWRRTTHRKIISPESDAARR